MIQDKYEAKSAHDDMRQLFYSSKGLKELDELFCAFAREKEIEAEILGATHRRYGDAKIDKAIVLEKFLINLFRNRFDINLRISDANDIDRAAGNFRKNFIMKRLAKVNHDKYLKYDLKRVLNILREQGLDLYREAINFERTLIEWLREGFYSSDMICEKNTDSIFAIPLEIASYYAVHHPQKSRDIGMKNLESYIFRIPQIISNSAIDMLNVNRARDGLIHGMGFEDQKTFVHHIDKLRQKSVIHYSEASYCLYCHQRNKDSCRGKKGEMMQSSSRDAGSDDNRRSNMDVTISNGCPLGEYISEMHILCNDGFLIAALAIAMVNNPLLACTGYRICNDCVRSCIFQKQTAVDTPFAETALLDKILAMPYGFEIYSLLTRWNPIEKASLNIDEGNGYLNEMMNKCRNAKVLVVGMGPAGFTLAYYLIRAGIVVVGIDGCKIEPLPESLSGIRIDGSRRDFKMIEGIDEIYRENCLTGFGGVMAYGITDRWNKKYLNLIRLILERDRNFRMYGGTFFGGNISYRDVLSFEFDHIALATGAGTSKIPYEVDNVMAKNVHFASDFLMSIHLNSLYSFASSGAFTLRLPIVVVGGGLTAVDAAVEAIKYYAVQTLKYYIFDYILTNQEDYKKSDFSKNIDYRQCNDEHQVFLTHGEEVLKIANYHGILPKIEYISAMTLEEVMRLEVRFTDKEFYKNIIDFINRNGGVTLVYRDRLENAASYRVNSDELRLAFCDGMKMIEFGSLQSIVIDDYGACAGAKIAVSFGNNDALNSKHQEKLTQVLECKSILFGIGTNPNFEVGKMIAEELGLKESTCFSFPNDEDNDFLLNLSRIKNEKVVPMSHFGDMHARYSGSVVKAMASAKNGVRFIFKSLSKSNSCFASEMAIEADGDCGIASSLFKKLDEYLLAQIIEIKEINSLCGDGDFAKIEMRIRMNTGKEKIKIGQYFKLQRYLTPYSKDLNIYGEARGARYFAEPVPLMCAGIDEDGLLMFRMSIVGASTLLLSKAKIGEYLSVTGPLGAHIDDAKYLDTMSDATYSNRIQALGLEEGADYRIILVSHDYHDNLQYLSTLIKDSGDEANIRLKIVFLDIKSDIAEKISETIFPICNDWTSFSKKENIRISLYLFGNQRFADAIYQFLDSSYKLQKYDISNLIYDDYSEQNRNIEIKCIVLTSSSMQCMMRGICGQCLMPKETTLKDGSCNEANKANNNQYACREQYIVTRYYHAISDHSGRILSGSCTIIDKNDSARIRSSYNKLINKQLMDAFLSIRQVL